MTATYIMQRYREVYDAAAAAPTAAAAFRVLTSWSEPVLTEPDIIIAYYHRAVYIIDRMIQRRIDSGYYDKPKA